MELRYPYEEELPDGSWVMHTGPLSWLEITPAPGGSWLRVHDLSGDPAMERYLERMQQAVVERFGTTAPPP